MGAVTKALANVVEVDDAAGATLIGMAVYDYLTDQAAELGADLDRMYGAWALDRIGVAKRQLGRSYVEKTATGTYPDDSVQMTAQWLAGLEAYVVDAVAKAGEYEGWATRVVYRDPSGRFSRDLSGAGRPNVKSRQATGPERLAPGIKPLMGDFDGMDRDQQERMSVYQGQYERAGNLLFQMARSFRGDDRKGIEGVITVRNSDGKIDEIVFPLSEMKGNVLPTKVGDEWDVNEDGLSVSIQANRDASESTQQRVAAFNSLGVVGGTALQRLAEVEPQRWQNLAGTLEMPATESDQTKLTRFFNQLSAGGRVLQQITGQERLGEWAQFVGSMGPQAEQVLGPYVQRAAYRYRGTERTPDRSLVGELKTGPRMTGRTEALAGQGLSGDSLKMQARADVAAAYLAKTLPRDPIFRRLSEKAGNVLPSQGVLIDADGDVVSQAVGYADDHYLPFDLKGLSRLRGGQYVRTRMSGGPTAEDIYTAVHTGARMLTVVSPSGVYTLEFDPSFRGARAGSDKARQMNDRYIKILDAVKGSGLYLQDIDPSVKNKIKAEVARQFPGTDAAAIQAREAAETKRVNQARMEAMQVNVQALQAEARQTLGVPPGAPMEQAVARQYEDVLSDLIDQKQSEKVSELRLNGEGYAVALQTLQQQFPYFLKAPRYENFSQFRGEMMRGESAPPSARFATDSGYVGPGALRPGSVRSGFYNYQGLNIEPKNKAKTKPTADPDSKPTADTNGSIPAAAGDKPAAASPDRAPDTAVPAGGIWQRLRKAEKLLSTKRDADVRELYMGVGSIPIAQRGGGSEIDGLTFEEVASGGAESDIDLAKWFMQRTAKQMLDTLKSGSPLVSTRLLPVLQNREVMESAFNSVLVTDDVGGDDWFAAGGRVGGQSSLDGALDWLSAKSRDIADFTYMQDPFSPVKTGIDGLFATGQRPQGFEDITAISDQETFDAFRDSDVALSDQMEVLAYDGNRLRDLSEVARLASKRIEALKAAQTIRPALAAGDAGAFEAAGIDEQEFVRDLLLDEDTYADDAIEGLDIEAEALRTQRAWSLYVVGRGLELMGRAGGPGPKGEAPTWSPVPSVRKAQSLTDPLDLMRAMKVKSVALPRWVLEG
jgi:hypothetical protein